MSDYVTPITDGDFESQVIASPLPALVDVWAEWCGPCKRVAPLVEQIAAEHPGRLHVFKLNADENPQTPARYSVLGLPALLLFKGGELVEAITGYQPKDRLLAKITPHL